MVCAILDGRKTVTRRVVKPQPRNVYHGGTIYNDDECPVILVEGQNGHCEQITVPYRSDDILYMRETWVFDTGGSEDEIGTGCFAYKADGEKSPTGRWHPSLHMPKEAARLFLRVTDVRVERLQDISDEQTEREGCRDYTSTANRFYHIWDSTIKPKERSIYGWDANPWVWVIKFERISREEANRIPD